MKWLNNLKLAVINKDIRSIEKCITNITPINKLADAHEALALIQEAIFIVEKEKEKTLETINKIRKTKVFLNNQ